MRLASIVVGRDMRIWRDTGMPPGEEFVDWMVLDDGETIVVLGAEFKNPFRYTRTGGTPQTPQQKKGRATS
jgi:hypothetical protein